MPNITKVPCRAIIIKARVFPENIGKVVEVLRPIVDGETYDSGNLGPRTLKIVQPDLGPFWLIESEGGYLKTQNYKTGQPELIQVGVSSDYGLRPLPDIDGESDERETSEESTTKSPASVQG